jgi:hypothetical protein
VVLGLLVTSVRTAGDKRRGLLLGVAAGVLFGLTAGMLKLVTLPIQAHQWPMEHWPFWALIVVGVGAIVVNQAAFRATRLSVSMPVVNIVNVGLALAFGWVVFGERLFSTPVGIVLETVALLAMGVGVQRLASQNRTTDASVPETAG